MCQSRSECDKASGLRRPIQQNSGHSKLPCCEASSKRRVHGGMKHDGISTTQDSYLSYGTGDLRPESMDGKFTVYGPSYAKKSILFCDCVRSSGPKEYEVQTSGSRFLQLAGMVRSSGVPRSSQSPEAPAWTFQHNQPARDQFRWR